MSTPEKIKKAKQSKNSPERVILPMSVREFKAKLEGIEMFQGDDWHPDETQWKLIRKMIDNVVEMEVKEPIQQSRWVNTENRQPVQQASLPSSYTYPTASLPPLSASPQSGTIPSINPNIPIATPDIDTSGKDYTSSFI